MQTLERDIEILRHIPLFAGLPTPQLKLVAYTAEIVRFEPGEAIVQQGDPADAVYIIAEGEAELWLTDNAGHETRLAVLGAPSFFGESAVACRSQRAATVRAKGRVVTFRISANAFLDLMRQNPDICMRVMTKLAQRLERNTALLQHHQHH